MSTKLKYNDYEIELSDDKTYSLKSADNNFQYDNVYHDEEALQFQSNKHSIRVFSNEQLYKSAIVCAVGGGTGIFARSAVIWDDKIFICCANKVFSLSLPNLKLNVMTQVDMATCFGIYQADNGLFTHGELRVTRLDKDGKIVWEAGLRDIIVYIDKDNRYQDAFVMHENYIALMDFNGNNYQLDFDGKLIGEQLSEQQKRWNLIDEQRSSMHKKRWWKFWS